jgi:hypothetical protein
MQAVMNLRGTMPAEQLLAETKKPGFVSADYTERRAAFSLALLRQTESKCDVQLADWIEANYRQSLLFHSVDHPSNLLLQRQFDPVFDLLSLPRIDLRGEREFLRAHCPPVYPCVLETLELPEAPVPALDSKELSYDDYVMEYASLAMDDPVCKASVLSSRVPESLPASSAHTVQLCLRNDSATTWYASSAGTPQVALSYHWMRGWEYHTFDNIRTPIPRDIPPGESMVIDARLHTPHEKGDFTLAWDCVIEHVCWFSNRGCVLPRSQVRIV